MKDEVVARVQEIAQSGEAGDRAELNLLKQLFYKFHNAEVQEAFKAFVDGARVCLDDRFKVDSEYGYVLVGILPKRYHYMKSFCLDMLDEDPSLARYPKWNDLLDEFKRLDAPFAEERRKDLQEFRANRAFYFGRR